ncbi:MAG: WD40 repeat domain-containing protein [Euryarchaeota archaeon]|nr:WD40 repeat domain-containing protein [Euryarchaeota archaeon]
MNPKVFLLIFVLLTGCVQKAQVQPQPAKTSTPAITAVPRPAIELKLSWKYKTDGDIYGVGVTSNAEHIAVGSWDNHIYLLNRSGQLLWNKTFDNHLKGVDVGVQGVVVGSGDGSIYFFHINGTKAWEYRTEKSAWGVWDAALSKEHIFAGGDDGSLYLLSLDGTLIWTKNSGRESYIYGVAISQDKRAYFFRNRELFWERSTGFSNYGVAISRYTAVGSWDRHLYVFDRNGNLVWKYDIDGNVNRVAFSPDGSYLAAASSDGCAYLFEIG